MVEQAEACVRLIFGYQVVLDRVGNLQVEEVEGRVA